MIDDEVIAELHKVRDQYGKEFDYDLDRIFADLKKKQAQGGRKVVSFVKQKNKKKKGERDKIAA